MKYAIYDISGAYPVFIEAFNTRYEAEEYLVERLNNKPYYHIVKDWRF